MSCMHVEKWKVKTTKSFKFSDTAVPISGPPVREGLDPSCLGLNSQWCIFPVLITVGGKDHVESRCTNTQARITEAFPLVSNYLASTCSYSLKIKIKIIFS